MIFHPYVPCRGGPAVPIDTIFGIWGHTADVITHVKFQVDRSKGLGSTGTQNRVFLIDFDRRPYNSVRWVTNSHVFGIPDPILPIHFATFKGLQRQLKVVY